MTENLYSVTGKRPIRVLIVHTFRILIPTDMSCVLLMSSQIITMMFVGHNLGEIGISQYSASVLVFNVCALSITNGFSAAIDTIGSHAYGRNHHSPVIGEALQLALVLNFTLGTFISIFFLNCKSAMNTIFGEEVGSGVARFLAYGPLYLFLSIISNALSKTFFAQRQPMLVAYGNAAALVTSPIANYFLTPMGIEGAVLSLSCNTFLIVITAILLCFFHPSVVVREAQWPSPVLLKKESWISYLRVGIPSVVAMCSEWWAFEVQALFAVAISPTALAIYGVAMNIVTGLFSIALGVSVAASVTIGNALGSRDRRFASQYSKFIIVFDLVLGGCTFFVVSVFGGHIARLYTNVSYVSTSVESLMPLVCLCHMGDSLQYCLHGIYRGAGRSKQIGIGVLLTLWLIGVPASALYVFVFDWGVKGAMGGLLTGFCCEIPMLLFLMSRWDWAKLEERAQIEEAREVEMCEEEHFTNIGYHLGDCRSSTSLSELEEAEVVDGGKTFRIFSENLTQCKQPPSHDSDNVS